MATPSVTPSDAVAEALAKVRAAIATLSPQDQVRVNYALTDLEPVIQDELDAVAGEYLAKLPVFGGLADGIVKDAVAKALEAGLAELTAARSSIGG
jgi:hypothetical protein